MGKYKIPRNLNKATLYGGLDLKGWVLISPFVALFFFCLYQSYPIIDSGREVLGYTLFCGAAFIALLAYGLVKPLPQLTERPIVYIWRTQIKSRYRQKTFYWGRKK